MKKTISLLMTIIMAISLLGCSKKSEEKYTFQKEEPDTVYTKVLYVKDDSIQRYVTNAAKTYENKTEDDLDFLKKILENDKKSYDGLEGIKYTYEVTDHSATVDQELNVINKDNLKAFLSPTEYQTAYDEGTEAYSFEQEKKYLELAGYTLKE